MSRNGKTSSAKIFPTEMVAIELLKPHPKNYHSHPADQIEHIKASIQEHGFYRNIVIARENTILAGHGSVQAARELGYVEVPCYRLNIDPNSRVALKVLAGDNEIEHLAVRDDRALADILKEIQADDPTALLGTGFTEKQLANLVFVTRPQSEIEDFDAAAHWAGMPDYDASDTFPKLVISFRNKADRERFVKDVAKLGQLRTTDKTWSGRWPAGENADLKNVRFVESGKESE